MAYTYEALTNDKVKFLQGTQESLNTYLPDAKDPNNSSNPHPNRGQAQEGAFYLTTDTHRLYIGRKVTTGDDVNKVFPEEVAGGITVLDNWNSDTINKVSAIAQEGEFYYIKSENIFCVYTNGNWAQINPVTPITTFSQSVSSGGVNSGDTVNFSEAIAITKTSSNQQYAKILTAVGTDGNSNPLAKTLYFKPGDNVTFKTTGNAIEISSANSQSTLTTDTTTNSTNAAPIILTDNETTTVDTSINLKGVGGILVNSNETNGEINIVGPTFQGNVVEAKGTVGGSGANHGFKLNFEAKDANNTALTVSNNNTSVSLLDPSIIYGSGTTSEAFYYGGKATLDIYTKAQTDTAISNAISSNNRNLDALVYKGTINSATTLDSLIQGGTLENGWTYKAAADFVYNNKSVYTGDLLIVNGGTETNGKIPTNASASIWEIVPSGDEPLLEAVYGQANTVASSPFFALQDKHITETAKGHVPFKVIFDNTNSSTNLIGTIASTEINTTDNGSGAGAESLLKLSLKHLIPNSYSSSIATNSTLVSNTNFNSTNDSIGSGKYLKFLALKPSNGIVRDSYGHVTAINTQEIVLKHNHLTSLSATYSASNNVGDITLGASDDIGSTITSANIKLTSSSLKVDKVSGQNQLSIDMVWESF